MGTGFVLAVPYVLYTSDIHMAYLPSSLDSSKWELLEPPYLNWSLHHLSAY